MFDTGMPSTMNSGWFSPRIEPAPRITMRCEPPMLPDWLICRPDTLPDSALMSVGGLHARELLARHRLLRRADRRLLTLLAERRDDDAGELRGGRRERRSPA